MDLRQLRTLSEVAERGSFSAAAEALGVSQPAVSQQIRALEREIGEPLLDRGGRGARLTEQGVMVQRYAQRMLALSDEFQRELADGDGELTGSLVVGSSTRSSSRSSGRNRPSAISRSSTPPSLPAKVV